MWIFSTRTIAVMQATTMDASALDKLHFLYSPGRRVAATRTLYYIRLPVFHAASLSQINEAKQDAQCGKLHTLRALGNGLLQYRTVNLSFIAVTFLSYVSAQRGGRIVWSAE